jgi:Asp/Glu/Hydantoin racemase
MESVADSGSAEREAAPNSRHVGLVGGLGVGAAVIYYRAIAGGCTDRGVVPRITIAHTHAPTVLEHVGAGRIDELADYLAGFVEALRDAGAEFIAIPAITPRIAIGPLTHRTSLPINNMLDVTAKGLHDRRYARVALFGTRFTMSPNCSARSPPLTSYRRDRKKLPRSIASTLSSRRPATPPRRASQRSATSLRQSAVATASTPSCWRGPISTWFSMKPTQAFPRSTARQLT